MHKRGVSRIVVILLFIIFALAAVIIIWNFVRIFIEREGEIGKIKTQLLTERIDIISVQFNPNDPSLINISIRKNKEKLILNSTETIKILSSSIDTISAVDVSGSMRACHGITSSCCTGTLRGTFDSPNRCDDLAKDKENDCINICGGQWEDKLLGAQNANKELVNSLINPENNNRVGFVTYSRRVVSATSIDLTNDEIALENIIDLWDISSQTCICCGINDAKTRFEQQSRADRPKVMIVMSDGQPTRRCPEQNTRNAAQDAIKAACDANATLQNLIIYSVGFGSDVEESTLQQIAQCGNGQYFFADIGTITDTYKNIAQEIKKTSFTSIQTFNYIKVVFYNETSSHEEIITNIPENIFETKKYNFNLLGKIDNVERIEIFPVIVTKSGKEIIGQSLDIWKIK